MTILKYKECDVCKKRSQLEPPRIGGNFTHWITVCLSDGSGYLVERHLCGAKCLQSYASQREEKEKQEDA